MLFRLFNTAEGDGDFQVDHFFLPGRVLEIGADPLFGGGNCDRFFSRLDLPVLPDAVGTAGLADLGDKVSPVGFGLPAAVILPPAGDPVIFTIDLNVPGLQGPARPRTGDVAGAAVP